MDPEKKQKKYKEAEDMLTKTVFLDYVAQYAGEEKAFAQPNYFKEELGIEAPGAFEKKLEKEGYLRREAGKTVRLTEKGLNLLEKHQDYIRFFNLAIPYVTAADYLEQKDKKKGKKASFEEVMITLLLEKVSEYEKKDDYETVGNLHFEIGRLYREASYDAQTLYHYLIALYFQVNGLEYYDALIGFMQGKRTKKGVESIYDGVYIDPHLVQAIAGLGSIYYDDMADAVYEKNPVNVNMCPPDKFKELAAEIAAGKYDMVRWRGYFFSAFNGLIRSAEKVKTGKQ